MDCLERAKLQEIKGGGAFKLSWYLLGALVTLAVGIIDGIVNPEKCKKD